MKKLILLVIGSIAISACSGGASNTGTSGNSKTASNTGTASKPSTSGTGINIKIKDKSSNLDPKSAFLFSDDWTVNMPDGKAVKTAMREMIIANYDLDTQYGKSSAMKKTTSIDQMRIVIQLADKEEISKDAPPTIGDYPATSGTFSRINNIMIYSFVDGAEMRTLISGGNSDNKGGVKITSATADTISGEIDITTTDNSIKGNFTAKVWKQAK